MTVTESLRITPLVPYEKRSHRPEFGIIREYPIIKVTRGRGVMHATWRGSVAWHIEAERGMKPATMFSEHGVWRTTPEDARNDADRIIRDTLARNINATTAA